MAERGGGAGAASGRLTWQAALYAASPALLYTLLANVAHGLLAASGLALSGILRQALSVTLCLAFFCWYATKEPLVVRSRKRTIYRYPASFCYAMAVVMCGVASNYVFSIIMSKLGSFSPGFRHATTVFYSNSLLIEILTLCVIGPLAEELVYRGFVYQRLRARCRAAVAAAVSALLFGVMHFNLVQGIYAFVLGILLAHIVDRTGSLLAAIAAHMAANLVSVLWTETDWLDFLGKSGSRQYAAAMLCIVLTGIFLSYGNQLMRHGNSSASTALRK